MRRRLCLAAAAAALAPFWAPADPASAEATPVVQAAEREPAIPGFRTATTDVGDGVRLFYRVGGRGGPVVLLHGYTQTGHMWSPLARELARDHTVIIPDLRGAGRSSKPEGGYDKKTMARDVNALVRQLGHERVKLVGHDIGLMVAYAYAAQWPSEVERLALMEAFLPGVGEWKKTWLNRYLWHFHFHGPVPEALVQGRERTYFEHFWNDFAADARAVSERDRRIYTAAYAQPDGMRAGMQYFAAFEQDARDFGGFARTRLPMPVLAVSGEKASGQPFLDQVELVSVDVVPVLVRGSGHWLLEEQPAEVIPTVAGFLRNEAGGGRAAAPASDR